MEYECQTKTGRSCLTEDEILTEAQTIIWSVLHRNYVGFERHHDDISQDVLIDVYKSLNRYDPKKGNIYSYIKVIVKRKTQDYVEKAVNREKHITPFTSTAETHISQRARGDPAEVDDESEAVIQAFKSKLNARERKVLELKEDGRTSAEIYKALHPRTKKKHPGQAISAIMANIAAKAEKYGFTKKEKK